MRRYTVIQLTAELTQLIGDRYPAIEVEGEVSQLSVPASGHCYLTMAEGESVLAGVVWRSTWQSMPWQPKRGDRIVARGKLGVYPGKGGWQLYVNAISRAGEGALAAEIARRRAKLESEGLLDPRRKRPLPRLPRFVGVATSLTGAALQDFLKVSRERFPAARILVSGCLVQGPNAAGSVVSAIDLLLADGRSEVIIVTRGGGSKEDLLAFQDEALARYLAHCPVPVISAVGHQVDTTLADLVADAVAPTPTGAAVLALPDAAALAQQIDRLADRLAQAAQQAIVARRRHVTMLRARLRHPGERLAHIRRRAVDLTDRLRRVLQARLAASRARVRQAEDRAWHALAGRPARERRRVTDAQARLQSGLRWRAQRARARLDAARARLAASLHHRPARERARVDEASARLQAAMRRLIERRRDAVDRALAQAGALSPAAVLSRGYAVVTGPGGVITDATAVAPGDAVTVRVHQGSFGAVVRGESG